MSDTDDIFLKRFSLVIAILVGIAIVCAVIAGYSTPPRPDDLNPSRVALTNDRTLPVGAVRTEVTEADIAAAAAPATAAATPTLDLASIDTSGIDGSAIYATTCQACHGAGVAGAPIPGSDLWAERAGQGIETLAQHAVYGLNAMPAKGGRPDLSDAEVIAAVEFMLAQ